MLLSAIQAGLADLILNAKQIPNELVFFYYYDKKD